MKTIVFPLLVTLMDVLRSRASLQLEVLVLRQQLSLDADRDKKRLSFHKSERIFWVWLNSVWPACLQTLKIFKPEQESDRSRCRGGNWVFPANRLYDSAYKYNYHWPLIRKAARLVDFKFHELRHTAATLMINNGVDLKTVSEILGHSDVSVTSNHYAHLMQKTQQEASQKLAAVLEPLLT